MDSQNKRKVISISFPAWLAVLIKKEAEKHGQSLSAYIRDMFLERIFNEL